jgi:dUTPase
VAVLALLAASLPAAAAQHDAGFDSMALEQQPTSGALFTVTPLASAYGASAAEEAESTEREGGFGATAMAVPP